MDQSAARHEDIKADQDVKPTVLFDISRLISRVKRAAPTGVDRVELAFALWLMRDVDVDLRFVAVVGGEVRLVNDKLARRLVRWISKEWAGSSPTGNDLEMIRLAESIGARWVPNPDFVARNIPQKPVVITGDPDSEDATVPAGFGLSNPVRLWARGRIKKTIRLANSRGSRVIYVNVSHHHLEKREIFKWLREIGDIQIVFLIHDVIPLDFPEYCRAGDADKHRLRMNTVGEFADTVIVNSADTGRRVKDHIGSRQIEIVTAHLGLDPRFGRRQSLGHFEGGKPYFAIVSTIEARKNHLILLNIWRRIVEEAGENAPNLVIVGRRGWEAEAAVDMLDRCTTIQRHVHEATGLSDDGLVALLNGARAALMPSFTEGFGLPVAEALTLGVPVISSDVPALVEVGQGIPEHLDPLDGLGWKQTILDYAAEDSSRRDAQMTRIERLEPYSWARHFEIVAGSLGLVLQDK